MKVPIVTANCRIGVCSIQKPGADHNEDSYFAEHDKTTGIVRVGVFDGIGGAENGELASQESRDSAARILPQISPDFSNNTVSGFMTDAVMDAHAKVEERNKQTKTNSGSTSNCLVILPDGRTFTSNCGDSRTYKIFSNTKWFLRWLKYLGLPVDTIRMLTLDDNYDMIYRFSKFGKLVYIKEDEIDKYLANQKAISSVATVGDVQKLNTEQGAIWNTRNTIYNSIGMKGYLPTVCITEAVSVPGDMYVVCTDGLVDDLTTEQILRYSTRYTDPKDTAKILANEAVNVMLAGKSANIRSKEIGDDVTVVVVKL